MPDHPLRYSVLKQRLKTFGIYFDEEAGKGSHVVVVRDNPYTFLAIKHHKHNPEIPTAVVATIRKNFGLKVSDGVSDRDFYGHA